MRDIWLRSREKVGFRKRKSQLFDELNFWSFHSPTRGPAVRIAICFSALATHILMSLQLVMLKKRGGGRILVMATRKRLLVSNSYVPARN